MVGVIKKPTHHYIKKKMETITKENKQLRREMRNEEILSIDYEGVVLVNNKYKIIMNGPTIDTLNTNKKIINLWYYYCKQEGLNL